MTRQLSRLAGFVAIGLIGFVVEATVITVVASNFKVPPIIARAFSFPPAVLITWWLNRKYNFRSQENALSEGVQYFLTQSVGALANLCTFAFCVSVGPVLPLWPIVALAFGACVGLVVNFGLAYVYVFRTSKVQNGK